MTVWYHTECLRKIKHCNISLDSLVEYMDMKPWTVMSSRETQEWPGLNPRWKTDRMDKLNSPPKVLSPCVIMLQYKTSTDSLCERYNDRVQDLVNVPSGIQVSVNDNQVCFSMAGNSSPYHDATSLVWDHRLDAVGTMTLSSPPENPTTAAIVIAEVDPSFIEKQDLLIGTVAWSSVDAPLPTGAWLLYGQQSGTAFYIASCHTNHGSADVGKMWPVRPDNLGILKHGAVSSAALELKTISRVSKKKRIL